METGDEAEGTPRCLREGDDGEVSCSGTCVGAPPPDLQPRWRTGSPWLLDRCDEEARREEQSSPTFNLQ